MKKQRLKIYFVFILTAELVGILGAILTGNAQRSFGDTVRQLPLTPPSIVFPVVWSILYALMGWGAARVYMTPKTQERTLGLMLYWTQLGVNFLWSFFFFNAGAFGLALVVLLLLWVLVLWMTFIFWESDRPASLGQIPYLLWLGFAGYLALGVFLLNMP